MSKNSELPRDEFMQNYIRCPNVCLDFKIYNINNLSRFTYTHGTIYCRSEICKTNKIRSENIFRKPVLSLSLDFDAFVWKAEGDAHEESFLWFMSSGKLIWIIGPWSFSNGTSEKCFIPAPLPIWYTNLNNSSKLYLKNIYLFILALVGWNKPPNRGLERRFFNKLFR